MLDFIVIPGTIAGKYAGNRHLGQKVV